MKRLNDISVKSKLRMLSILFAAGVVVLGILAYRTINQVRIGSAIFQDISESEDQLADFQPPSQFILVPRILVYQMRADINDPAKLQNEVEKFRTFTDTFEKQHQHWLAIENQPAVRDLIQQVYEPAHQYLELGLNGYIPLLLAGKVADADALRIGKMNPFYATHETAIDKFTAGMNQHIRESEGSAEVATARGIATVATVALLELILIVTLTLVIGNGMVTPLQQTVEVLNEVSKGNLTRRLSVEGHDEVAQMGTALNQTIEHISRAMSQITADAQVLFKASGAADKIGKELAVNSQQTTSQASAVSSAAEQVSQNVQTVSTAAEEMSSSIKEISKNASEAAEVASSAARLAGTTNATMTKLSDSSAEIGNVIKVITSIAGQTNLLALNATIEAARAGEAGKGFAVVANEVKELAKETAKATEDIGAKIVAIQQDAKGAVQAIDEITTVIGRINDIQNTIASAVEEQTGTTNEISRNVAETARGSSDIASNIVGVANSAKATQSCAAIAENSAAELTKVAQSLTEVVGQFQLSLNGAKSGFAVASR